MDEEYKAKETEKKEIKVSKNWQDKMQMVAFMCVSVICFFMFIHTRLE